MGSDRQHPVTCDTNKQVPWLGNERGHLRSNKERHDENQDFNNMSCLRNVHELLQTEQFRYDDYVVHSLEDIRPVRGRVGIEITNKGYNKRELGSSAILFVPNMSRVYSTVQICLKTSSKKVTSFVIFVPTNNRRMSSEYIIAHRIYGLFWTSRNMID